MYLEHTHPGPLPRGEGETLPVFGDGHVGGIEKGSVAGGGKSTSTAIASGGKGKSKYIGVNRGISGYIGLKKDVS